MKEPDWVEDEQIGRYFKHFRDKDSVTNINAWVSESDTLSKEDQMKLIESAPLKPSMVIESNKSYHIYYFAID
jgi:hypothetical protein